MPFKNRDKKNEYRRKWYAENSKSEKAHVVRRRKEIKAWLDDYRSKLKCTKCHEDHPATLDFHHRNRKEKEFGVTHLAHYGYSITKIKKEMAKCIILCANCHRKLHYEENKKPYKLKT